MRGAEQNELKRRGTDRKTNFSREDRLNALIRRALWDLTGSGDGRYRGSAKGTVPKGPNLLCKRQAWKQRGRSGTVTL